VAPISPFNPEKSLVSVPIVELTNLSLVPAGNPGKIPRNSGDSVHIPRTTVTTNPRKATARPMAAIAGGELRAECDLIVLGMLEGFSHKIGQGFP
jgi:hypothetical protein